MDRAREVVRMKNIAAGPTLQFLKGLAEIVQIFLIDEFDFAGRRQSMNQAGNAIEDQAKTLFARAQGFLDALPVVNIRMQGIPADDTSVRVA